LGVEPSGFAQPVGLLQPLPPPSDEQRELGEVV
jgi:hypothetical protein